MDRKMSMNEMKFDTKDKFEIKFEMKDASTLKILWSFYWGRIFSGQISIADWLLPHHALCPGHLSTKITKRCQSKLKIEGNQEKNV